MRAGRMWVLLVLAAVFSMHGLQCMTADTGHAEQSSAHVHAKASPEASPAPLLNVDVRAGDAVGMVSMGSAPVGHESPASGAAHLWATCLAVVMTGMTVLGALSLMRKVTTSAHRDRDPALRRPSSWTARGHRLRPPDLAALCLLRI